MIWNIHCAYRAASIDIVTASTASIAIVLVAFATNAIATASLAIVSASTASTAIATIAATNAIANSTFSNTTAFDAPHASSEQAIELSITLYYQVYIEQGWQLSDTIQKHAVEHSCKTSPQP